MSAIVWMDMEMSGLEPETDRILEVAVLVTDGELEVVAEGPNLVVHQADVGLINHLEIICDDCKGPVLTMAIYTGTATQILS